LFLWENKVFLRDTVSHSRYDIIRIFDTTWNSMVIYGWFTDERDGKIYRSAKIGNHLWMAQNLNYQTDTSWCYNNDTSYCGKYGRLYNWASALNISQSYNNQLWKQGDIHKQGICPYGWHIPNNDESDSLLSDADGTSVAGLKLKASSGWNYDGAGRDSFGFRALPTGYRDTYGKSVGLGDYGIFWSATEYGERSSTDWQFSISYYVSHVVNPKIGSFSVRCVKD
jgi:uncharacterized protein (TIGR02145 family)